MFVSATSLAFPQAANQAQARAGSAPEAAPKQVLPAVAASLTEAVDGQQVDAARQWLSAEVADFAAEVGCSLLSCRNCTSAASVLVPRTPSIGAAS